MTAARFPYPISVVLFNRPEYVRATLESLKEQTLPVASDHLILSIDGYAGSKDETFGRPDRTGEVEAVAREVFPDARLSKAPQNRGIARHFALVEQEVFRDHTASWAAFFEDDFVLSARYLEIMATLISYVDAEPRIVQVSATGDTILGKESGTDTLYPMWHAWAFALRREHYQERSAIVDEYLRAIADLPYFMRSQVDFRSPLLAFGLYPIASSQDYIKQEVRRHFGGLAVTTARSYGRYIGKEGEHFTPAIFADLGYECSQDIDDEVPALTQDLSAALADLYQADQRAWAMELDAVITSRIESAAAQADLRASTAEARLLEDKARIAEAEARLAEAEARLAEAEARLAEALELAVEARNTGSELRTRLSQLQALYDDALYQTEMVKASHSWRFTAGFRILGGLLRTIAEKLRRKTGQTVLEDHPSKMLRERF
jgi:hypothetical protein